MRMWPDAEKTQDLLAQVRSGDQAATERLLERHRQALRQMVQMRLDPRLRQRLDVSDVVQEVLVEASRRLQEYLAHPTMPYHLWLRQIARDRIIDAYRRHRGSSKRSLDREMAFELPGGDAHSTQQLLRQLVGRELTPAQAAVQAELAQLVAAAIRELPEQDAEILLMRHYEQLSNQEIAQALGLTEPAASMRYLRALRRLKERLSAPPGPPAAP
jgi:RNA polymerase sigma-70 factor (ECF subfamily)